MSRYKIKVGQKDEIDEFTNEGPPLKVFWYLPIIPRLKCMFANSDDTKNLRWHAENRKCDGLLRHPAILCNGRRLIKNFLSLEKNQET